MVNRGQLGGCVVVQPAMSHPLHILMLLGCALIGSATADNACNPGYYGGRTVSLASECKRCPTNTFAAKSGATECEPLTNCIAGHRAVDGFPGTTTGDRGCTMCVSGKYNSKLNGFSW
jgi:hypothetical protein